MSEEFERGHSELLSDKLPLPGVVVNNRSEQMDELIAVMKDIAQSLQYLRPTKGGGIK